MTISPLVSIVIPIYNAEKYLMDCLTSVTTQTYPNIEVILVDDSSKDNSMDIAARWIELNRNQPIIAIRNSVNMGECKATAIGFNSAHGKYIIRMSCDDKYIDNEQTAVQVAEMERYNLDWCYINRMMTVEEINSTTHSKIFSTSFVPIPYQPISGLFSPLDNFLLQHKYYCYFVNIVRNPINVNSIMIRATSYHKYTSWDQELMTVCDAFITGDLIIKGAKGRSLNNSIAFWRIHKDQQTQTAKVQAIYKQLRMMKYDRIKKEDHPILIKIMFEILRRIFK